jgi:hypothetical protein
MLKWHVCDETSGRIVRSGNGGCQLAEVTATGRRWPGARRAESLRGHLFLLRELVKRDFKGRYAGSVLGFFWSFVQPLWLLLLFSFVFATVMRISPVGERTDNFGVFLFCGLLPWMAIHEAVLRGSTAITDNAELVKKLRFPSQILVLAVALAAFLHELIALAVFVVVLAALGELSGSGRLRVRGRCGGCLPARGRQRCLQRGGIQRRRIRADFAQGSGGTAHPDRGQRQLPIRCLARGEEGDRHRGFLCRLVAPA